MAQITFMLEKMGFTKDTGELIARLNRENVKLNQEITNLIAAHEPCNSLVKYAKLAGKPTGDDLEKVVSAMTPTAEEITTDDRPTGDALT